MYIVYSDSSAAKMTDALTVSILSIVIDYTCDRWSFVKNTRLVSRKWKDAVDNYCPQVWHRCLYPSSIGRIVILGSMAPIRAILSYVKSGQVTRHRFDYTRMCQDLVCHGHFDLADQMISDPVFDIYISGVFCWVVRWGKPNAVQYMLKWRTEEVHDPNVFSSSGLTRERRLYALNDCDPQNIQIVLDSIPNITDTEKEKCFVRMENPKNVELFLKMGVNPDSEMHLMDGSTVTPLYFALVKDKWEMVKLLIEYGADPFRKIVIANPREEEYVPNGAHDGLVCEALLRYSLNIEKTMRLVMLKMERDGNESCIPPMIRYMLHIDQENFWRATDNFKQLIRDLLGYGSSLKPRERELIKQILSTDPFYRDPAILAELGSPM